MKHVTEHGLGRRFVLAGTAALAGAVIVARDISAQGAGNNWQKLLDGFTGGKKPEPGKVAVKMPEIAENGNTVPIAVSVDSPMTEADYVKAVHVVTDGNPRPEVMSVFFTPLSGKAEVSTRMRLARTMNIVAVAEMSDGSFRIGRTEAKVTIGGCGG